MSNNNNQEKALVEIVEEGQDANSLTKETYSNILSKLNDPSELVDLQMQLEREMPYLKLCTDEQIRLYFEKFGLPLYTKEEVVAFTKNISERIYQLAGSNKKLAKYAEMKERVDKIERIESNARKIDNNIERVRDLKDHVDLVMTLVYDNVLYNNFNMDESGERAVEKYKGKICISRKKIDYSRNKRIMDLDYEWEKKTALAYVNLVIEDAVFFDFAIKEDRSLIYDIKNIFRSKRIKDPKRKLRVIPIRSYERGDMDNFFHVENECGEEPIDYFIRMGMEAKKEPDYRLPIFKDFMKMILELPRYIAHYAQRIEEKTKKGLEEIIE